MMGAQPETPMNRSTLFTALLLFSLSSQGGATTAFVYDVSGEQFVQWMTHSEPPNDLNFRNREKAYSYLDGVKDVALGTGWCPAQPRKTFELAYDAADYIRAMPLDARRGNAARLLLSFLGSRYPCTKGADK